MATPERTARLVLVTADGVVVGVLPAIAVSTPWWQDVGPVVAAARARHGAEVTVLRLLEADRDEPPGGEVTYLAEVSAPRRAETWRGALDDHPLRRAYARPGGPAADLAWAARALAARDLVITGRPTQVRTWNLSSLWRLPIDDGAVWLKVVPPFCAHEAPLLAHLDGERAPRLLGHDGERMLLAEIAGEDLYEAAPDQLAEMVDLLVELQHSRMGRAEEFLALGLPDLRSAALAEAIGGLVERIGGDLGADDRAPLKRFVRALPGRLADMAACGIGDTLVHGDFHPGNFRGDGAELTLLDWGDSGVGCPLLDQAAFLDRIPKAAAPAVRRHWMNLWRGAVAGSDPIRAARLLSPIAAARQAVVYQRFLDNIEPAEHPYHRADPAKWLRKTAVILREEGA